MNLSKDDAALLEFIRGVGHQWGPGITTYPEVASRRKLHDACVRLEVAGLIRRATECGGCVNWEPVK